MVKKIRANQINICTSKTGPYLYYFNAEYNEINNFIVENMNILSNLYKQIKVFEIDWENQILVFPNTPENYKNKIFLLYEQKREEKFIQYEKDIKYIFYKCIQYHNEKLQQEAYNVGNKVKRIRINKTNINLNTSKDQDINFDDLQQRRRRILKRQIKLPEDAGNYLNIETPKIKHNNTEIIYKIISKSRNLISLQDNPKQKQVEISIISNEVKNEDTLQFIINRNPNENDKFLKSYPKINVSKKDISYTNRQNKFQKTYFPNKNRTYINRNKKYHLFSDKLEYNKCININNKKIKKPQSEIKVNLNRNYKTKNKLIPQSQKSIFQMNSKWYEDVQMTDIPLKILGDETKSLFEEDFLEFSTENGDPYFMKSDSSNHFISGNKCQIFQNDLLEYNNLYFKEITKQTKNKKLQSFIHIDHTYHRNNQFIGSP